MELGNLFEGAHGKQSGPREVKVSQFEVSAFLKGYYAELEFTRREVFRQIIKPNRPGNFQKNNFHFLFRLDQITQNGDFDALLSGARHKQKEADKADAKVDKLSQASHSGGEASKNGKAGAKGESKEVNKKKVVKEKKVCKDADGNLVKRPLSAYMLLNNFRRPVL